jgi:hypothetical protein
MTWMAELNDLHDMRVIDTTPRELFDDDVWVGRLTWGRGRLRRTGLRLSFDVFPRV